MIGDPKRFETVASGINKWVLTIAVLVGAVWTLYVYRDVPHREYLNSQSNLIIEVKAHQLKRPNDSSFLIAGVVKIKNVGNRNTTLLLNERGQIGIAKLIFDERGDTLFENIDTTSVYMWAEPEPRSPKKKTSLKGGTDYLPFVQEVNQPGIYHVSFVANRDDWDVERAGGHGEGDRKLAWIGATYVVVEADGS